MRFLVVIAVILLTGCFKTVEELREEENNRALQKQTQVQQKEYKEKAPPQAYRFEEYDEQFRQLSGRVDGIENHISQLNNANQGEKADVAKEKQAVEQKFVAYEDALKKLELQVQELTDEVTRLKTPSSGKLTKAEKAGAFEEASTLYDAKKWKEAIVAFEKYRTAFTQGKYFADATFKMGVCFQELGMKEEARAFYEEVSSKFPSSKEAKKAQSRMKTLK